MFGSNFGEKCIIMHFLGREKDGKDRKRPLTQRRGEKIGGGGEIKLLDLDVD